MCALACDIVLQLGCQRFFSHTRLSVGQAVNVSSPSLCIVLSCRLFQIHCPHKRKNIYYSLCLTSFFCAYQAGLSRRMTHYTKPTLCLTITSERERALFHPQAHIRHYARVTDDPHSTNSGRSNVLISSLTLYHITFQFSYICASILLHFKMYCLYTMFPYNL